MLSIQMQKYWWLKIYNNQKPEDYREIGPYWEKRFRSIGLLDEKGEPVPGAMADVIFQNGFREKAPRLKARVTLRIRGGEEKWGAAPGKKYYVLSILKWERVR